VSLSKKVANAIGYGNALKIKYFFQKPKPKEIIIDICAACNAACPFCPRLYMPEERMKGYMDLELLKFILSEAKKEGIQNIRLYSTAEPTLHPKFDEIIDLLKKDNFYISVSTNASMLDKHIDALMKVDILQFSIEGWDRESYEKYRFPLKFDKVYSNIKYFYEEKLKRIDYPKISSNLLLTKNINLQKYMKLWGHFIDTVNIHFMYNPVKYENGKFIEKSLDTTNEYYSLDRKNENYYCEYPFNILTIAFDGKIALCCDDFAAELDMGNIKGNSILDIFQTDMLNQIRSQFYTQELDLCKECTRFTEPKKIDIDFIQNQIESLETTLKNKIIFDY